VPDDIIVRGIQVRDFPDERLSIKGIFAHNQNWDRFRARYGGTLRDVEIQEAEKLLNCHGPNMGWKVWRCDECHHEVRQTFGCNSKLCTRCGKPHADQWAMELRKSILPVRHRHLTFTVAQELRPVLKRYRDPLLRVLMDATMSTLKEALGEVVKGKRDPKPGAIAVLHPFGRDLEWKPHVHVICLEGAFQGDRFRPAPFFPMDLFRRTWQYQVLTLIRTALKKRGSKLKSHDWEGNRGIDQALHVVRGCFEKDGFYVHVTKETRVQDPDRVIRYVGRYVRHPAIAESRLVGYDGQRVTFRWTDHKSNAVRYRTLSVDEFIEALLQHVMEPGFRVVRHYGVYARRTKGVFRRFVEKWIMKQSQLTDGFQTEGRTPPRCHKCGVSMRLWLYQPPEASPDSPKPVAWGRTITDWNEPRPSPQ
jgi:hypothetical protein